MNNIVDDMLCSRPSALTSETSQQFFFPKSGFVIQQVMCETKLFRTLANEQAEKLTQKCQEWSTLQDNRSISEDVVGQIRSVIGSTQLLINDKIRFFHKLLDMADNTDSEKRVTREDLQAYWDLIVIEINDVNSKFKCLQELFQSNWTGNKTNFSCKQKIKNTLRTGSGSIEPVNKSSSRRICSTSTKKNLVEEKELIKKAKSDVRNGKISNA